MSPHPSKEVLNDIALRFERDGYARVRGALSAEEMTSIQAQWQRVREGLRAGQTVEGMKRDTFYVHGLLPSPIGDVAKHPVITEIAKKLLGPDVALYLNRLNVKDQSFTDSIHLHQDIPYFNGKPNKVNFFIALQDINLNNGAMVYVPGSHSFGILDRDTIDISRHPDLEVVVPSLRPGDLVIADIRLWHSSVPNTLGTDRVLLQMIFQPADDGSYYPLSVPEPTLVTGEWHTSEFTPWEIIKATEKSSTLPEAATATEKSPTLPGGASADSPAQSEATDTGVPDQLALLNRLKARLPTPIKRPLRYLVSAVKKNRVGNIGLASLEGQTEPARPKTAKDRKLPNLFTASTGPEQVWPLAEEFIDWASELEHTARVLKKSRKTNILFACRNPVGHDLLSAAAAQGLQVVGLMHVLNPGEADFSQKSALPVFKPEDLRRLSGIDAIVVLCTMDFGLVIRRCEQFLRPDILFVPAAREAIAPAPVRATSVADWANRSSILTYLYVSALRGHFAEFGTFWGRAFFSSFYELHHWLNGNFYAFDSFAGLSEPDPREKAFTNGDFSKGAYGFNHASFCALSDILGLPHERIVTVPGFFDASLTPENAVKLGIAPKSLSVCRIDCDLIDPTLSVLNFISPLLDDGALIYFDDWRLCRADPNLGERGAVLRWLKANPSFDLVDFPSIHWQHQWFIFHRNKPA
jgi:ectoine hydroxylase-related dioxygenase (phytanoyl-CoA dioxygenase family)